MANIKSAKKRVLVAEANRVRNVAFKSSIKTAVKKALELATSEDKEALNAVISEAEGLTSTDYEDFSEVEAKLAAAKEVATNENALQSEVDAAE